MANRSRLPRCKKSKNRAEETRLEMHISLFLLIHIPRKHGVANRHTKLSPLSDATSIEETPGEGRSLGIQIDRYSNLIKMDGFV